VIFDTWTLNCDRYAPKGKRINRDNVFLSEDAPAGRFLLRAMDHSHCFTCGKPLSPKVGHIERVKDERIYGLYPEFRGRLDRRIVRDAVHQLRRFPRKDADILTEGIPREWDVDQQTRDALILLLVSRAAFLADSIMDKLCPSDDR
jgi:hypothetical protein